MAVYGDLTNVAAEWSFPNVSDRRLDGAAESSWRSPAFLLGLYNNNDDIDNQQADRNDEPHRREG